MTPLCGISKDSRIYVMIVNFLIIFNSIKIRISFQEYVFYFIFSSVKYSTKIFSKPIIQIPLVSQNSDKSKKILFPLNFELLRFHCI